MKMMQFLFGNIDQTVGNDIRNSAQIGFLGISETETKLALMYSVWVIALISFFNYLPAAGWVFYQIPVAFAIINFISFTVFLFVPLILVNTFISTTTPCVTTEDFTCDIQNNSVTLLYNILYNGYKERVQNGDELLLYIPHLTALISFTIYLSLTGLGCSWYRFKKAIIESQASLTGNIKGQLYSKSYPMGIIMCGTLSLAFGDVVSDALYAFGTKDELINIFCIQNMPQLLLQSYYFWIRLEDTDFGFDTSNLITVSSMFFSIISMIITLMSVTIENAINKTQDYIIISMDITGDCMDISGAPKCRTMKSKLTKYISRIIGVDMNMIEIVKPMYIAKGLSLDIIIYVNDNNYIRNRSQMYKILIESNENGKLPKLLQKAWKLKSVPLISSIIQQTINSEQTKKTVSENNISKHIQISENIAKNHGSQNNVNNFSDDEVRRDSQLINYIQKQNHAMHAFRQYKNGNIGSFNQVHTTSNTAANSRKITLGSYDHNNMSMPVSINNDMLMEGCENKEHTPTPPPPPPPPPYNPNAMPAFVNKMSSKKKDEGIETSDAQSKISELSEKSETYKENGLVMSDNKSLEVLNNMGYMDKQKNMMALKAGGGNLSATVQYLIDNENEIDNEKENDNVRELEVSITIDSQFKRAL